MEKGVHVIYSTLILVLGVLLPVISGENCPFNPDCSCFGSVVSCYPKCGSSVPKFAASSKQFSEVLINGSRDINQILPDTFQQLSTTKLSIEFTGISHIDCDAFSGITTGLGTLALTQNYLESVPSCSLQHAKGITRLTLTGNRISNLISDAFNYVPNLISLFLDQNEIETIEIGSFNTLTKLSYLSLNQNKLSHLVGSVFEGLSSLRTLLISSSKIKSIHPKSFDGLESLTYLQLIDNEIGSLDGTTFGRLVNITTLYLGNNVMSSLPEKIFSNSVKLKLLSLEDNQLVSLPDNIFQNTPLLKFLYMQRNNLSSISRRLFIFTPNLRMLYLSGNQIVHLDSETFKGLNLGIVYIDNNHLTTVQPDVFKDCYQLGQLFMKKNRIRDLQPGSFRNLSSLWKLDLSENYLSEIRAGVFYNSTRLSAVNLAANMISFIENGALESQQKSLSNLNLESNNLTYKTLVTLTPLLTKLNNLKYLDLSHNPIGDLPTPIIDSFNSLDSVGLRNCSLADFLVNNKIYNGLDLSANHLKNFSGSFEYSLNVSYNNLQSITIWTSSRNLLRYTPITVDAKRNKITKVDIVIISNFLDNVALQFSNNLISSSIAVNIDITQIIGLKSIDLSYNKFNTLTIYPIKINTSIPGYSDLYRNVRIDRLNLSHNNIRFVSPEAFLGTIGYLDLSHNIIEAFGRLVPANAPSSDFKTHYLDLSGNLIHRISSDVFYGYQNIIKNIDLAQNSLTEIQSLRTVLEEDSFERLYVSDNPVNWDCKTFWLRQSAVPSRLDSARCDAPDNAKGYLSYCYPLKDCSLNQALNISASVLDLCRNDIHIRIDNLQFTTLETVGNSLRVNVTWVRYGHGKITGYRVEVRSSGNSENLMTSLVHPAAVNYIPFGLRLEMAYNVCISAQREQVTVSEVVCKSLQVEATNDNSIIISKSTRIGISSALGICVLCLVLLLLCYFIRLQKVRCGHQKDTSMEFQSSDRFQRNQTEQYTGDKLSNLTDTAINQPNSYQTQDSDSSSTVQETVSNPVNTSNPRSSYEHPSTLKNEVTNSNTYETINNGGYENCSNRTEEQYSTLF